MQKEDFLKELRRILLLDETIEKEVVELIINSTCDWIESNKVDVTDVEIQFNKFELICLLEIILYNISKDDMLFYEKNTKISNQEIKVDKNSWIVTYDAQQKIFKVIFVND